ncbi:MAG: hypothetical protein HY918_04290 [Candidatus Doudnabacteria bacterium]|nr:hypothetical protein [Candidatus Doudnabacteria bacterium]
MKNKLQIIVFCLTLALLPFAVTTLTAKASSMCEQRTFPCAYGCDENTGECFSNPNGSGDSGNQTTPGIAGSTCSNPGEQSTCGAGLICNSNLKCAVPGVPDTTPTVPGAGTGGPNSSWCNNDPNLVYSNGVCLPKDAGFATTGIAASSSLSDLVVKIIKLLLTFAGAIGVLILVIGGFWYITSAGNEELAEKGKKTIINALIGLVVVVLAYTIVSIISATLISDKLV